MSTLVAGGGKEKGKKGKPIEKTCPYCNPFTPKEGSEQSFIVKRASVIWMAKGLTVSTVLIFFSSKRTDGAHDH